MKIIGKSRFNLSNSVAKTSHKLALVTAMISPNILLKSLEWFLYFCLCFIAFYLSKDVLNKYHTQHSTFNQYEEPITKKPTITICFGQDTTYVG